MRSWCLKLLSVGEVCYIALSPQSLTNTECRAGFAKHRVWGYKEGVCVQCLCILCPGKSYVVTHTHTQTHRKTWVSAGLNRTKEQAYHRVRRMWGLYPAPGHQVPPVPVWEAHSPASPACQGFLGRQTGVFDLTSLQQSREEVARGQLSRV